MKCKNCNANLQIEDEKCPYCGAENPFAKKHRADMKKYAGEFASTRSEVLENSSRFNRYTVKITIVAVLLALCVGAFMLQMNAYEVREYFRDRNIGLHKNEHIARVTELLDDGNYIGASNYVSAHGISYVDPIKDYYDLFQILREYNYITDDISAIITWNKFEQHYQQKDEVFNRLSQNIKYLHDETIPRKYAYEGSYSEDKLAYMQAILADTEMLLKVYMGLKNDDFTELYELSDIKRTLLLEERYGELINE
ncbi:MAG: zinc ribbon domain-containing protein [Lachnospiraceae bacterium]|nr:zinc ribbon domain-containing protein [Lachnospiraceae bacterium]